MTVASLAISLVSVTGLLLTYDQLQLSQEQLKLSQNQSQTIFDGDITVNANATNSAPATNFYPGPGPSPKWTIDASQFKSVRIMYILNFSGDHHADAMTGRVWGEHYTLAYAGVSLSHGGFPYFGNYTITVSENTYFTSVVIDCDTRNGPQVFCDWKGAITVHLFVGTFSTRL